MRSQGTHTSHYLYTQQLSVGAHYPGKAVRCLALTDQNYRETKGWFRQLPAVVKDLQKDLKSLKTERVIGQ
jgi:hypothetical protein